MAETVIVPLDSILFLEEIYPRVEVDSNRISYFEELITNGGEPPPLQLAEYDQPGDGIRYVLLDGKHRSEAYTALGVREVPAYVSDVPRKHWRLKSAGFNAVASSPLTSDEMRQTILDAWVKDGIRDVKEIAELIGNAWTPRHINRALKSLRDQERKEREARVLELKDQGLAQKEIAAEVGVSEGWVSETLQWIRREGPRLQLMAAEMPVEIGSENEGHDAGMTAFPKNSAAHAGLSEDNRQKWPQPQVDPTDTPEPVIPTELIDKIKAKAQVHTAESGQRRWRRHLKNPPTEEITALYRDAKILRRWITDINMGSYDKTTVEAMHECSRKLIILGNELHRTIRDFLETLKRESDRMAQGIATDHQAEKAAVNKFMARKWSRIQGLSEEDRQDLRMELYLAAVEARQKWDGEKSSIETWLANNLDWTYSKLAEKEYKRRNTLAEYRNAIEQAYSAGR